MGLSALHNCAIVVSIAKQSRNDSKRVPKNLYWERLGTVPDGIVPKSLINAPNVDREEGMTMMKMAIILW